MLVEVLRSEKGCPWDREQTHKSIRKDFIEETYEVIEAIDTADPVLLREELGDVLLQVMFQAVMAEEEKRFTFDDVANAVSDKLVRRHPHVFGDVDAKDSAAVLRNWERIKQLEHRKESRHSALDGVPAALPALIKAQRTQEKAARVGFDWQDAEGPLVKIAEELEELKAEIAARKSASPADSDRVKEELGDLLFSVCNLARHLKVDSESALEGTTAKFSRRFRAVEAQAKSAGRDLKDMTLAEMDKLWENVKSDDTLS
jgi:MazG family protein